MAECACGGQVTRSDKTISGKSRLAEKWAGQPIELPVKLTVARCQACGRQAVKLFRRGRLVFERG